MDLDHESEPRRERITVNLAWLGLLRSDFNSARLERL
jgi:hypothetical protein